MSPKAQPKDTPRKAAPKKGDTPKAAPNSQSSNVLQMSEAEVTRAMTMFETEHERIARQERERVARMATRDETREEAQTKESGASDSPQDGGEPVPGAESERHSQGAPGIATGADPAQTSAESYLTDQLRQTEI